MTSLLYYTLSAAALVGVVVSAVALGGSIAGHEAAMEGLFRPLITAMMFLALPASFVAGVTMHGVPGSKRWDVALRDVPAWMIAIMYAAWAIATVSFIAIGLRYVGVVSIDPEMVVRFAPPIALFGSFAALLFAGGKREGGN